VTLAEDVNGDPATQRRVVGSFVFFALLLAAYYLIRPVRDSLVAGLGSEVIKYLSTLVLVVSLAVSGVYAWFISRVPRRFLVPGLYALFALTFAAFAWLFAERPGSRWVAEAFYLWVAVFNLWMVATFWSFMADLWPRALAQRHFGRIAAGGSLGGLAGPWLARHWATNLGPAGLTAVAGTLLLAGAGVAVALMRGSVKDGFLRFDAPLGGDALSGLKGILASPYLCRIALLVAAGSVMGMFVYIEVARNAALLYPNSAQRTAFFAARDLWVNSAALVLQLIVAPWLMRRVGAGRVLILVSLLSALAFGALMLSHTVAVLLALNVSMRTIEFGLGKPARDVLYTVLPTDTKYSSKNLIDTTFYRACDSTAGWLHALFSSLGGGLALLGGFGLLTAAMTTSVSRRLARAFHPPEAAK
jgi:AAA family ATP:ADP antiporter